MNKDDGKAANGKESSKKQRTIQVKIGGQAAKTMTPDQAADYLKTIASKGAFGGAREMKLTFGKGGTATASVGPATNSKLPGPSFMPPSSRRKDPSIPCSEKEMKALMSMFVEIMGLQMNTDKLNKPRSASKSLFKFPDDLPPPPGGWPEMWPHDNDDDSVDSVPELMDFDAQAYRLKHPHLMNEPRTVKPLPVIIIPNVEPEPVAGLEGIVPLEWDSLERIAIEDALEQEERARKNVKAKDTKKNWKKERARKDAQVKAKEELLKKREKIITNWKSRVASSMQSLSQLEEVLEASPLRKDDPLDTVLLHVESLLPLCVSKNRASKDKGRDVRERLVAFLIDLAPDVVLVKLRNGRSIFHTACFHADSRMILMLASKMPSSIMNKVIEQTCFDSGFAPSHYAAISGSFEMVEALLSCGKASKTFNNLTNDSHTWHARTGKGFTPRQLLECLVQNNEKLIESHGMAVPELSKDIFKTPSARGYLVSVQRLIERLKKIEINDYIPLAPDEIKHEEELAREATAQAREVFYSKSEGGQKVDDLIDGEDSDSQAEAENDDSTTTPDTGKNEYDHSIATEPVIAAKPQFKSVSPDVPLVIALVQMGFEREQVMRGIRECGGVNSATPDEVVAWIFGQDSGTGHSEAMGAKMNAQTDDQKPASRNNKSRKTHNKKDTEAKRVEVAKKAEEDRLVAERLAAKREEQRRRNREWNRQARQLQGVQTQIVDTTLEEAPALITGLDFGLGLPQLATPNVTEESHGLSLRQSVANDASTIGSIVEINVEANDDQTVSTLGSWQQTRPPPLPVQNYGQSLAGSQQILPPGFDNSMFAHSAQPVSQPNVRDNMGRDLIPSNPATARSSGLLESQSMLSNSSLGVASGPDDYRQTHLTINGRNTVTDQNSYGFNSSHGVADQSSLRMQAAPRLVVPDDDYASALPHQGFGGMRGPSPQTALMFPNRAVSSPIGFALNSHPRSHTESSFIDSISTGAGGPMLGDASFYQHGSSANGSSLLGNVIQSSNNMRGRTGLIGGNINMESLVPQNPFATADERPPGWRNSESSSSFQRPDGSIW
ncbi:hypothetical protein MPSEU_000085100 [Mayamaea pseudoterrestris]|nr:hypothetical protein MPSEU_000085100 [Mayamaea pseudoterrestris]